MGLARAAAGDGGVDQGDGGGDAVRGVVHGDAYVHRVMSVVLIQPFEDYEVARMRRPSQRAVLL